MEHGPLIEGFPLLKGLVCGSLIAGSFTIPLGILVQIALFIIAVLVFFDTILITHKQPHIVSFLIFMFIGIIAGISFALANLIDPYMLVIFVVMAILYLYEYLSYRERRRHHH